MTAISDIQQPALETPVGEAIHRSRARVVRRLFVAFLIGLALRSCWPLPRSSPGT